MMSIASIWMSMASKWMSIASVLMSMASKWMSMDEYG